MYHGGAQLVSFLPPILFFHSAYKLKIEHFCSISQFLRRQFRQISLRKIILLTLISVRKLSKISFFFGSLYFKIKFLPYGFVQYLCHTLYGYQVNFVSEFSVYIFVLFHHIFLQKARKLGTASCFE